MHTVNLEFLYHQQSLFAEELVQYVVKYNVCIYINKLSTMSAQKSMQEDIQGKAEI